MKKYIFLIIKVASCLFATAIIGQESVFSVDFPDQYFESNNRSGTRFMALFLPAGDQVHYNDTTYTITYPPGIDTDGLAVALFNYSGQRSWELQADAPVLVENYRSENPIFYLVTSASFDFTNALVFKADKGEVDIVRPHYECKECLAVSQLKRASYESDNDKRMTVKYMGGGPLAKNNDRVAADFWFAYQDRDCRYTEFNYNGETYSIGLKDLYRDGLFNEAERDRIMFARGSVELSDDLTRHGADLAEGMRIGDESISFEIVSISPSGSYINLKPSTRMATLLSLKINNRVKDLPFADTLKNYSCFTESLHPNGYTLVDAWGSWCRPCMDAIPEVKAINNHYGERLKVIGFNVGDTAEKIRQIEAKNGISWHNMMVSENEAERFGINGYPRYLLFNSAGTLLESTHNLQDVYNLINEAY